jgi:sterol desaturase/sphingolipid hydroxylase (fatty acid hydroxylase superfamily)
LPAFLDHQHLHALLLSTIRLGAWLVLLAVVFLPLERLFAVHRRKIVCKSLASDVGFYFISGLVPVLLLTPPLALVAIGAHAVVPWRVQAAVAGWPIWARALGALVVGEIGFYWGHRWTHEIPFLWRFHSVHHNPTQVYFLISARAHPIDNVFTRLCGLIPVYILGLATPLTPAGGMVSAVLVLVLTMWGFLIHANVRWRFGPLEWVISTPAFHHWHHSNDGPAYVNKNYASMLPLADLIFGTLYLPRDRRPARYGIEAPIPPGLFGQLLQPLLIGESGPALPASPGSDSAAKSASGPAPASLR